MSLSARRHYTVDDYFSVEESSNLKHEYYDGEIFAMAGASLRHNRITGNVFAALRAALAHSGCEVFASDLRVRTPGGLYTYPDVMVVCGGVQLSAEDRLDTVINPLVIIEVLSESTRDYDRGEKFRQYQSLPSLREYLLIEQTRMAVEQHSLEVSAEDRQPGQWARREYTLAEDHIRLPSLDLTITVRDIYAGVDLPPETQP